MFATSFGIRNLVLSVISFNQVLHDASRLEQVDGRAIGKLVGQGRNTTIRVYGKKPVFLLCVLADVDLLDLVGKTATVSDVSRDTYYSKVCLP